MKYNIFDRWQTSRTTTGTTASTTRSSRSSTFSHGRPSGAGLAMGLLERYFVLLIMMMIVNILMTKSKIWPQLLLKKLLWGKILPLFPDDI